MRYESRGRAVIGRGRKKEEERGIKRGGREREKDGEREGEGGVERKTFKTDKKKYNYTNGRYTYLKRKREREREGGERRRWEGRQNSKRD